MASWSPMGMRMAEKTILISEAQAKGQRAKGSPWSAFKGPLIEGISTTNNYHVSARYKRPLLAVDAVCWNLWNRLSEKSGAPEYRCGRALAITIISCDTLGVSEAIFNSLTEQDWSHPSSAKAKVTAYNGVTFLPEFEKNTPKPNTHTTWVICRAIDNNVEKVWWCWFSQNEFRTHTQLSRMRRKRLPTCLVLKKAPFFV